MESSERAHDDQEDGMPTEDRNTVIDGGGGAHDARGVFVRPGEGEAITTQERREVVLLAEREQLSMTWSRYASGERGPDLHVHREHTDAFYVLDGELTFMVGPEAEKIRVAAGGFVAVPPNVVHSFANEGAAEARYLNLHAPDKGFAAFLRRTQRDGGDQTFDSFDPPPDGGLPATNAIVSGPGEGERVVSGNRVTLLKGVVPDLCFAEWALDGPYDGPDVHRHEDRVDAFYVLEGELDVSVEGAVQTAGRDTLAWVPPNTRHTFAHRKPGTARVLNVHAPDGGFADFLRRISDRDSR
jgi:quercetin dioxygenase-like cupin family protein